MGSLGRRPRSVLRGAWPLAVAAGYVGLVRPRVLHWGATPAERRAALPGDDLIAVCDLQATRAIAISATAEEVWPWIAQMGQGRGGLYSYDALENLAGLQMRSANRIHPEWQDVAVGDPFRLHPEAPPLQVAIADPGRALVALGDIGWDPPPFDFSWAFVLAPNTEGTTRLLIRERYRYCRWWAPLLVEPTELASLVMTEKMLRGIRDRAQGQVTGSR
jgi:hypothetical protein